MIRKLLVYGIFIFAILAMVITACKEDEAENKPPTCEITNPTNGQEIAQGDIVTISVDANDTDGDISEVRFYIDNIGTAFSIRFPFTYVWQTTGLNIGIHNIKAISIDNNKAETSDDISVIIIEKEKPPIADFSATPLAGMVPLTVSFTDLSTNNPTNWLWDFGDGGTSIDQNPYYTYNTIGTYSVRLTTTNSYGSDDKIEIDFITAADDFSCGAQITDYDGNIYNTILIGSQCWMKENLNTEHDASGNSITRVCYDNDTSNCNTYGGLYSWNTLMNGSVSSSTIPSEVQGICPNNWHIPSDDEWTVLTNYLGGANIAGGKLKEIGTTHWNSPNTDATDSNNFRALPGGIRTSNEFIYLGYRGYWWSSTEKYSDNAYYRYLAYNYGSIYDNATSKSSTFSVRCIKD